MLSFWWTGSQGDSPNLQGRPKVGLVRFEEPIRVEGEVKAGVKGAEIPSRCAGFGQGQG